MTLPGSTDHRAVPGPGERTLVDALLEEQRQLTAVEQFARSQARHELAGPRYQKLLPASAPQPGTQYAFEVDLDRCSGCKACVTACHSLNGLDETETWRAVGMLLAVEPDVLSATAAPRPRDIGFQQHVTTACHHCADPACLNGCPVLAYDKDPVTGIVRHLDDQCIGCQYCVMMCPYEVPQYSAGRGIVRKCDMCSNRLAAGEAPACVQACPNEAIRIALVDQQEVTAKFRAATAQPAPVAANPFLTCAPDPGITLPTTQFVSRAPLPRGLLPADAGVLRPGTAHVPLVFLLVLSQLAVGLLTFAVLRQTVTRPALWTVLLTTLAALGIGTLHLGQPLKAWRGFLGWRRSWFSREVIVFGAFAATAALAVIAGELRHSLAPLLAAAGALTGLLGVACSAMIYVDTRRAFWGATRTFGKFLGTTVVLGLATTLVFSPGPAPVGWQVATALALLAKLTLEQRALRRAADDTAPLLDPLARSARLLAGPLGRYTRGRIACGLTGIVLLICGAEIIPRIAGLLLLVAGELLERHLFFRAEATPKMPGGGAA